MKCCYWDRLRQCSLVRSTRNQLLEYLENRFAHEITRFYGDIHTDIANGVRQNANFLSEEYWHVFELGGVAFRLVPPYGGLLVFSLNISPDKLQITSHRTA